MNLFGPPDVEKLKAKKDINGLIKALQYKKKEDYGEPVSIRMDAAKALGELRAEQAIPLLIEKLNHNHNGLSAAAYTALEKIGKPAVPWLIAACRAGITFKTIELLGELRDVQAVEVLIISLTHGDEYDRSNAAKALGMIGDKRAVPFLINALNQDSSSVVKASASALGELGDPRAVAPLGELIKKTKNSAVDDYIKALGNIGGVDAGMILIFWLESGEYSHHAKSALVKIGKPCAGRLLEILNDEKNEHSMRLISASILSEIGEKDATKTLLTWLEYDESPEKTAFKETAVIALGKLGDPAAIEPLIKMLKTPYRNPGQKKIVEILGKYKDDRVIKELINLLSDYFLSGDASAALKTLHWKPANQQESAAYYAAAGQWSECVKIGNAAVEPLIKALRSWNPDLVKALGEIGDQRAVEPLVHAISGYTKLIGNPTIKEFFIAAIGVLVKLGDERSVDVLIDSLSNCDGEIRILAAKALATFYHKSEISPEAKNKIEAQRQTMAAPRKVIHRDGEHSDRGIGVFL